MSDQQVESRGVEGPAESNAGGREDRIAEALRYLVAEIYNDCKGAYGAGDDRYEGQYESEIKAVAKAIASAS
jgi:hypothetical protein